MKRKSEWKVYLYLKMKSEFDFGVNAGLGCQFNNIFIKLQCNPGLYNYNNYEDTKVKNFNVAVTAGYFFN